MDNNQNNKPKITNINTMLEISNSVLLDRDSGDWTEWESMKKTNQKKRKKKETRCPSWKVQRAILLVTFPLEGCGGPIGDSGLENNA